MRPGTKPAWAALVGAALAAAAPMASAQMFHLYLDCKGTVSAGGEPIKRAIERGLVEKPEEVTAETKGDDRADVNARSRHTLRATPVVKSEGGYYLYLALRDNNMTAFVQRSNVLPVGERMKYTATNEYYAATYQPQRTGRVFLDFKRTQLFAWYPPFEKLAATRVSIDRQTGELEGEMVGPEGEVLGRMDMTCTPKKDGEGPAPRF
ncbi:MAG: hypothetical protein IPM15_07585 [Betaproteobacteria bacterium]|nr:hypothetical protein [Betaproteobacteria bacterium]MCC6248787.1 hypothetical protein [Rubrivivax sp.]